MKLKARQQLHVSSVRADTIRAGEEFEVSEPIGKSLIARDLASRVSSPAKGSRKKGGKNAKKPTNKMSDPPQNKSAGADDADSAPTMGEAQTAADAAASPRAASEGQQDSAPATDAAADGSAD